MQLLNWTSRSGPTPSSAAPNAPKVVENSTDHCLRHQLPWLLPKPASFLCQHPLPPGCAKTNIRPMNGQSSSPRKHAKTYFHLPRPRMSADFKLTPLGPNRTTT